MDGLGIHHYKTLGSGFHYVHDIEIVDCILG